MMLDQSIQVVRESLVIMLMLSAPILLAALGIGLIVSVLQAVTQVQEQTLSFVPKIVGMALVTIAVAPWMAREMMEFAARMFGGWR